MLHLQRSLHWFALAPVVAAALRCSRGVEQALREAMAWRGALKAVQEIRCVGA